MENNLDLDFYNQACQAFNLKEYKESLDLLSQFKVKNKLSDLSQFPFDKAFFDLILNFEMGRSSNSALNLNSALELGNKLLLRGDFGKEEIMQINIVMAESFLLLDKENDALNLFGNVINLDVTREKKTIWFKLLYLMSKNGGYPKKLKELAKITIDWEVFRIPTRFVLMDSAISKLDKESAKEQIKALKIEFTSLNLEQQIRLINACVTLSEFAMANDLLNISIVTAENYIYYDMLLANLSFYKKDYTKTLSILNDIKKNTFEYSPEAVLTLKARTYEKLENYDQAYAMFMESSKYRESNNLIIQKNKNILIMDYPKLYKEVDFQVLQKKYQTELEKVKLITSPTFLLGFPRSGTTLLDTILDTQPSLTVLSERSTIFSVIKHMTNQFGKRYPQDLVDLSEPEVTVLRKVYFEAVNLNLTDQLKDLSGQTIIDKMPLNTQHIPLILILFPEAKFIFAIRHPLDCIISSWQQNLLFSSDFNAEMTFLSTLEKTTKKYIDVMNHFDKCLQNFTLNIHYIKYESLVEDFKVQVVKLFDFLEVSNINDDYLTFNKHAKNKIINTPSRDQVTEGIYKGSVYKWKNYEKYLEGQIRDLKYFIDKFNY
jgi:hypothetical protein